MSTIVEDASDAPTGLGRLAFLIAGPAIVLTLMAALALQQDSPRRQQASETAAAAPVSGTSALPSARYDADYTPYIMSNEYDAHQLIDLGTRAPGMDWYAYLLCKIAVQPEQGQGGFLIHSSECPLIGEAIQPFHPGR